MKIDLTITRERIQEFNDPVEIEIDVEVELEYHKAYRGARDSFNGRAGAGPALEPDEPAYFEVLSAHNINGGAEIELTKDEIQQAEDKAAEIERDFETDYQENK